jgi:hypothetical protein
MPTCKEFFLDDALAITAIPISDYNPSSAAFQLKPTIANVDFSPVLTSAITIGRQPATTGGILIPIMRLTGKAKDDESDQTPGRLHKVTVSCQIDDRDLSRDKNGLTVLDHLLTLKRTPSHLLLTFRDLSMGFVQSSKDTYLCTVDRDGAKSSVQFSIECLMGIQMIA